MEVVDRFTAYIVVTVSWIRYFSANLSSSMH